MDSSTSTASASDYSVASDLSKLCLPQEYKDSGRRLAWANSICCLFLAIGAVGFKPPPVIIKPLSEVVDIVPVIINPPEEVKPPEPSDEKPPEPEETTEAAPDAPVVATVVAADASAAAFAVPVEGPVVLAPTRFAAPPPKNLAPPPPPTSKPVRLTAAEEDWGGAGSQPEYPGAALRNRYQGTVTLELTFDGSGGLLSAKVAKSSGFGILDNAALEKVRKSLRMKNAPGETRVYTKEFTFLLQ